MRLCNAAGRRGPWMMRSRRRRCRRRSSSQRTRSPSPHLRLPLSCGQGAAAAAHQLVVVEPLGRELGLLHRVARLQCRRQRRRLHRLRRRGVVEGLVGGKEGGHLSTMLPSVGWRTAVHGDRPIIARCWRTAQRSARWCAPCARCAARLNPRPLTLTLAAAVSRPLNSSIIATITAPTAGQRPRRAMVWPGKGTKGGWEHQAEEEREGAQPLLPRPSRSRCLGLVSRAVCRESFNAYRCPSGAQRDGEIRGRPSSVGLGTSTFAMSNDGE